MISRDEYMAARNAAAEALRRTEIVVSPQEIEKIDVADFGLSNLMTEGAQIVSLVETDKVAARVIVLFPGQTEPEHWHTSVGNYSGKQETLRVISGELLVYLPGEDTLSIGKVPVGKEEFYTARHEIRMFPTDTLTIPVGQRHWFQAGSEGAVFYTISTLAIDDKDPFTDPNVIRKTRIE